MKTIQLFDPRTNKLEDATIQHEKGEFVARFESGHIWKFPFTENVEEIREAIRIHNLHNTEAVTEEQVIAEEARANSVLDTL